MAKWGSSFAALVLLLLHGVSSARATVPNEFEPEYSEAVLSFNQKRYKDAVFQLDLLLRNPKAREGRIDFLELKALNLKSLGDEREALRTYIEIIKLKIEAKHARKELAPYYFESGLIYFKQNKPAEASSALQESLAQNFNSAACRFFLGNIAFKEEKWDLAEGHFAEVARSDVDELRPASAFYLARVYQKQGDNGNLLHWLRIARDEAKEAAEAEKLPSDLKQGALEIKKAAETMIAAFDKATFFGGVSVLGGYDSNVLSVPDATSTTSTSNTKTGSTQATLSGYLGYQSSPAKWIQVVPIYRPSLIYNFNSDTRSGNFLSHPLSVQLTRNPLGPLPYGIKFEGTYTFQQQKETGSDSYKFKPYSIQGGGGPFLKWRGIKRWILELEGGLQVKKEYGDADLSSDLKRSGKEYTGGMTFRRETPTRLFNPSLGVSYKKSKTDGTEYRAAAFTFDASNDFYFNRLFSLTLGASYTPTKYSERVSGVRTDNLLTASASPSVKLSSTLSLLGTFAYTKNTSNIPASYSYKKFAASGGISLSF